MLEVITHILVFIIFILYVHTVCYGHKVLSRGLLLISIMCLGVGILNLNDQLIDLKESKKYD